MPVVFAFFSGCGGLMSCGPAARWMAGAAFQPSWLAVHGGEAIGSRRRFRFERWEVGAMGFDRARFEAANVRVAFGPRRLHLAALDAVLCGRRELACGIVTRSGVPMLNVVAMGAAHRPVEVGCDYLDGAWSFTWADTGRPIGPVSDPVAVADRVAAVLTGNRAAR